MSPPETIDCLVIGGGPGGLTAATYLGRFRRSVMVVDAGETRLKRIPLSRNIPGFPEGISGEAMYARLRRQAQAYGARLIAGEVGALERQGETFLAAYDRQRVSARSVLLATGVAMNEPEIPALDDAIEKGRIRYCPICDAYEAAGKSIAVLGGRRHSIQEAHFLRAYSDRVTFLAIEGAGAPSPEECSKARRAGIDIEERTCLSVCVEGGRVKARLSGGSSRDFDILYPCLGVAPRSELARAIGCRLSEEGELITDKHQETNIPGLFAAGDVVRGLDQVAAACGQAAIAATAMHNRLRASLGF